jgi:PAS domain S-box-containing protein
MAGASDEGMDCCMAERLNFIQSPGVPRAEVFPETPEAGPSMSWLQNGRAILDPVGLIRELNDPLAEWFDHGASELAGQDFWSLLQKRCPWQEDSIGALRQGAGSFRELNLTWSGDANTATGTLRLELTVQAEGHVVRLESTLPGLTDLEETDGDFPVRQSVQRQLWARLSRAETQLKLLSEQWPGVIFSQRADFSFRFVSPRIEELTGIAPAEWARRPDLFWQTVHEPDAAELREQLARARVSREPLATTYRLRHPQTGRVVYVLEHRRLLLSPGGLILGYEGVWLDVTRQTLAETRLSSAAWKETLGMLTMSLAHDFGNVMTGIHALAESILDQAGATPKAELSEGVTLLKQQSQQATQLVRRIIDLHQGRTGECYYHDLNELIHDLADLVRKVIPRRMRLSVERFSRPLPVYLDAVEMRQVVLSLVMNAVEATLPDGHLVLRTEGFAQPRKADRQWGSLPRWPAAGLSICDDGVGIPPASMSRVFEPFFTTKPGNKGAGLGLYNARVFAERHRGLITVTSRPQQGAEFALLFPEADFAEATASSGSEDAGETPRAGRAQP